MIDKTLNLFAAALLGSLGFCSFNVNAWQSDNGDGTFTNPPLYADYPDPDIIRVSNDFYFATTTFANSPGLTILRSRDLVNWKFASHVMSRLEGRPQYDMINGTAYRNGVFAPSLRYHGGTFYIAVTPNRSDTRIYYATNVCGPWNYHQLNVSAFDPGLFIENDGRGYIATSGGWDGTLTILTLNSNFSDVVQTNEVYYNRGAEGSKVVKRGDWYYLFNAIPSRLGLTCSRATNLFGPWETIQQIDDKTGGHQGAIVDLPDGRDYGFVMKDCGAIGRMTFISPIFWTNGWPQWGTPGNPGKVPDQAAKPVQNQVLSQLDASDDFSRPTLGFQWQWNHNPADSYWSLTDRPGFLRLKPTAASNFWLARNTLVQKGQGPMSVGEVKFDLQHLKRGDICGFGTLGKISAHIGITADDRDRLSLFMNVIVDAKGSEMRAADVPVKGTAVFLRTAMDFVKNKGTCSYSFDGKDWTSLGGDFDLAFDWRTGTFQGEQFAIFCFNPNPGNGFVDVDWFRFSDGNSDRQLSSKKLAQAADAH